MRDAMKIAKRDKRLPDLSVYNSIDWIIESHRVKGFPVCEYDRRGIYWSLKDFVERNEKDKKRKQEIERARKLMKHYEQYKYAPAVRRGVGL